MNAEVYILIQTFTKKEKVSRLNRLNKAIVDCGEMAETAERQSNSIDRAPSKTNSSSQDAFLCSPTWIYFVDCLRQKEAQ